MVKVMDNIDAFTLPTAEPGAIYRTDSGAEFTTDKDGKTTWLKTCGCLGCDVGWTVVQHENRRAHFISADTVMYCMRGVAGMC